MFLLKICQGNPSDSRKTLGDIENLKKINKQNDFKIKEFQSYLLRGA